MVMNSKSETRLKRHQSENADLLNRRTLDLMNRIIVDMHINNKVQSLFWLFFCLMLVGFAGWLATIIGALIVRVIVYLFP